MEALYEYQHAGIPMIGLIILCIGAGAMFGAMIAVSCDTGFSFKIFVLTSLVIGGIMFGILFSAGVTKEETQYKSYITNWEGYCENYDTIEIEGKLVTARGKEDK